MFINLYEFRPDVNIEKISKYTSQRLSGTIHVKAYNGARFAQNSFFGEDYFNAQDTPFLFKEGANINAETLGNFILELNELKNVLEAMDLANKLSKE